MIRMDMAGNQSIEILADESATEELLREFLVAARPILEQLREAMTALVHEQRPEGTQA